jgi:SNF2 family DNA or RNA helicase
VNDLHGATAHYLIAPNTIEEDIVELIDDKRQLIDAVIDNKEMGESVSILGDLLVRLAERGLLRQQAA